MGCMVLKNCGASENPKQMWKCAELYFSSHNNIARWLGVNLGRTADTIAKSDLPKVNVRPFYRKFKSGSSETIHYMHARAHFILNSYHTKILQGSRKPQTYVQTLLSKPQQYGEIVGGLSRPDREHICEIR